MKKLIFSFIFMFPISSFSLECKKLINETELGFDLCLQKKNEIERIACSDVLEKKMGNTLQMNCMQDMNSLISRVSAKEKKLYPAQNGMFSDESATQVVSSEEIELNKNLLQRSIGRMDPQMVKGKPNSDMAAKCAQYVPLWKKRAQICLKGMEAEMKLIMQGKVSVSCNDQLNTDFEKSPLSEMCPTMMSGILLREEK
jgi:hypothetical protein